MVDSTQFNYCIPDNAATQDYNEKISFVGNLLNRTGNRIPETRADGVKMHKAITTVLTAMLSDINTSIEQFRRYIQLWAQGLHRPKLLTEGSQVSLRANFQNYMMHGMHNSPISDIKQVGQSVIEFGTKREEPALQYYQHQDEYLGQEHYRVDSQVDHHNHTVMRKTVPLENEIRHQNIE